MAFPLRFILFAVVFLVTTLSFAQRIIIIPGIQVTSAADSGSGSLREAIETLASTGETITFDIPGPPPHTIILDSEITIDIDLLIDGPGEKEDLIISGNNNSRIFNVVSGFPGTSTPGIEVRILDLTFSNGDATGSTSGLGGAIYSEEDLIIDNCAFLNNVSSGGGGAIFGTRGLITITDSEFIGNMDINTTGDSYGGALAMAPQPQFIRAGNLDIFDSRFTNNSSQGTTSGNGGAISAIGGPFVSLQFMATNIQINGNSANGDIANGGGLFIEDTDVFFVDMNIFNNTADGITLAQGGGTHCFTERDPSVATGTSCTFESSTISGNRARGASAGGGGLSSDFGGPLFITNSTISGNVAESTGDILTDFAYGGAIYMFDAPVVLASNTIAFNSCEGSGELDGAGIYLTRRENLVFANVEVIYKNNILAGQSFNPPSPPGAFLNCKNSLVGLIDGDDLFQVFGAPLAMNFSDDPIDDCSVDSYQPAFDAATMLGPLQGNGGSTPTHALINTIVPANPAIDAIDPSECLRIDLIQTRSPGDNQSTLELDEDHEKNSISDSGTHVSDNDFNIAEDQRAPGDPGDIIIIDGPPITEDQRDFPRPFDFTNSGTAFCDVGAFELQGAGFVAIAKISDPAGGVDFEFQGTGFPASCDLDGTFNLDDGESTSGCILPAGVYTVTESFNQGLTELDINCVGSATITPNIPGSSVDIELVNNSDNAFCTFFNAAGPGTVALTVVLEGTGTGSTVTGTPGEIDCTSAGNMDCAEVYPIGETVTLTATPDPGSSFDGWSGDCPATTMDDTTITLNVSSTCIATFTIIPNFVLDVDIQGTGTGEVESTNPGIDCTSAGNMDCDETYSDGTMVTLTATPDVGSMFTSWSGDAACTGDPTNPVLNLTMDMNISCIAIFDIIQVTLDVTIDGTGEGGVLSTNPGIDCNSSGLMDCIEIYNIDSPVTLTAMALPGSSFTGWSGDAACTGDPTNPVLNLTMDMDISCIATFVPLVDLTIQIQGSGQGGVTSTAPGEIDCSNTGQTNCDETYVLNSPVMLTASPLPGSSFAGWSGDTVCAVDPLNPILNLTMDMDISCIATFVLIPLVTLDVTIEGNGEGGVIAGTPNEIDCNSTGAMDCTEVYDIGNAVILTASPLPGSTFTGWSGDTLCTTDPLNPVLNLTMNMDVSCIATFVLDPVTLDVVIEGNGSCTVTSAPDVINCLGDCTETFDPPGVTVDLTVNPDEGSAFTGWSQDCSGEDLDTSITVNQDSVCVATCVLSNFVLNPIYPALDDNVNFLSAENATPNGRVAFTWANRTGSLRIGGNVCNGLELGLSSPRLMQIVRANQFGVATHTFFIPFFSDFEFEVQLQAVDVATCRTSNIVPQVIRKDES